MASKTIPKTPTIVGKMAKRVELFHRIFGPRGPKTPPKERTPSPEITELPKTPTVMQKLDDKLKQNRKLFGKISERIEVPVTPKIEKDHKPIKPKKIDFADKMPTPDKRGTLSIVRDLKPETLLALRPSNVPANKRLRIAVWFNGRTKYVTLPRGK